MRKPLFLASLLLFLFHWAFAQIIPCPSSFQNTFTGQGNYEVFSIQKTIDNGSILCGRVNSVVNDPNPESSNFDGLLLKLDADGNIEWSKKIGGLQYDEFRMVTQTSTEGYVAVGSTSSFSSFRGIYVVKVDKSGNILWSRNFSANSSSHDLGLQVKELSDNSIVIAGTNDASIPSARGVVLRLDANGSIIWNKRLYTHQGVDLRSIIEDGQYLVVSGDLWSSADNNYYATVFKLDKNNGNPVIAKRIRIESSRGNFDVRVYKTPTGFSISTHIIDQFSYAQKQQAVIKLDPNFNLISGGKYSVVDPDFWSSSVPTIDGGFVTSAGDATTGFYLFKLGQNNSIQWKYKYGSGLAGVIRQQPADVQEYPDGSCISASSYRTTASPNDAKILVVKTTSAGVTSDCPIQPANFSFTPLPVFIIDLIFTENSSTAFNLPANVSSNSSALNLIRQSICSSSTLCDSLKLSGQDTVCKLTDTVMFTANRNASCKSAVNWRIDTAVAKIIRITDSTIEIKFKKTGSVKLYGKINTACGILEDSMTIDIPDNHGSINLGPDQQLCARSTLVLHPGANFIHYKWQDGSSDSTYTVFAPGTYFVEVEDHCGNFYRDTINITFAPLIPFDLGPDITKCMVDTISVTAPPGFVKYTWSPDYHIDNPHGQTVSIWTDKDTSYSVIAEKATGCLAYDTIRISLKSSTIINLGPDSSFCSGDSLILTAPPGFISYQWSTGETGQIIVLRTTGIYTLTVTAVNGCRSIDAVEVKNVYPPPAVNIGKDTFVCRNGIYVFDPGAGYRSYVWQNGSTGQTFQAVQPGQYWVSVVDIHNCKNSDTAFITAIAELPTNFLDTSSEFCPYEKLTIPAKGNYKSYRWSNGSKRSSIEVTNAGIYWLEVTNAQGCTNREYIDVKEKKCEQYIYFPNAFTPSSIKNNFFKPIVSGGMVKYHFYIYNRWGQKVFETSDLHAGWDGRLKGKLQDANSFVWYCQYQFPGQMEKTQKGTMILIR